MCSVIHGSERGVLIRRTHSKFIAVVAADDNGIGIEQSLNGRGRVWGCEPFEDPARGLQGVTFVRQYILQRNNKSCQSSRLILPYLPVDQPGPLQRLFGVNGQKTIRALALADLFQVVADPFFTGSPAFPDFVPEG
jgi:hypothetical protein